MLPELAKHSEKLVYFFEIANTGSLQATARKLGISAPSLSHSMKELEAVTRKPLFHRTRKGVSLTDAGDKLFIFCRRYYRELEAVQRLIDHPDETPRRKIKIGTFQSVALYFWPLLIESLPSDNNLSLSITTNRSKVILESLVKRDIDIALTVEVSNQDHLIKHQLYEDEYAFYISRDLNKASLNAIDTKKFAILYIPDAIDEKGKSLRHYLHSWGLVFRDEFELDSFEVVAAFIKKGYGIGILPTRVAKGHTAHLRQLKIRGILPSKFGRHRFFLSYRDDLDIPQRFINSLLDVARKASNQLNNPK